MAWSETSKEFRKAIDDDRKRFKGRDYRGKYVIDNKEVDKLYNKLGSLETIEQYSKKNPERLLSSYQTTIVKADGFSEISDIENIEKARDEFKKLVFDEDFSDFLTLPAYHLIN